MRLVDQEPYSVKLRKRIRISGRLPEAVKMVHDKTVYVSYGIVEDTDGRIKLFAEKEELSWSNNEIVWIRDKYAQTVWSRKKKQAHR